MEKKHTKIDTDGHLISCSRGNTEIIILGDENVYEDYSMCKSMDDFQHITDKSDFGKRCPKCDKWVWEYQ